MRRRDFRPQCALLVVALLLLAATLLLDAGRLANAAVIAILCLYLPRISASHASTAINDDGRRGSGGACRLRL